MSKPNFKLLILREFQDDSIDTVCVACTMSKRVKPVRISKHVFIKVMNREKTWDDIMNFMVHDNVIYVDMLFASVGMVKCLTA